MVGWIEKIATLLKGGNAGYASLPALITKGHRRKETHWIILHCSATKGDMDVRAVDIDRWHRQRGWDGIGYHFVITRSGQVQKGRAHALRGIHVRGYNSRSIGICLVGGVDEDMQPENNFTQAQFTAMRELVAQLREAYPQAKIAGHRDFDSSKTCPCFTVQRYL